MPFDAPSLRAVGDPAGSGWVDAALADEVAVDFPSVRPIVDRMRRGFLGGEDVAPGPLSAEVRLTPMQAWRGARVPVEVPVRHVCRTCGGRGEVWSEPCPDCAGEGTGVRCHAVEVLVPSGVSDGAWLSFDVSAPHEPVTRLHLRVSIC